MVGEALSQMWDYLEYHVYDRWEISIQEFLMEVAIVEDFTVYMAEMITGRNDVESLLERIQWIGNFMDIVRNGLQTQKSNADQHDPEAEAKIHKRADP